METPAALGILVLLSLLQVKHAVCDGPLQRLWMLREKGFYGKAGGLAHAAIHGAGSLAALVLFDVAAPLAAGLAVADTVLHYHIDFAKETLVRQRRWAFDQAVFWWALTVDQMLHQFTYIAMAAVVIVWA